MTTQPVNNKREYIFISLYLVVIAFFIILNSISTIEHVRKEAVLSHVRDSFSLGSTKNNSHPPLYAATGSSLIGSKSVADIIQDITNKLNLIGIQINTEGDVVNIRIPNDEFFVSGKQNVQPIYKNFVNSIANGDIFKINNIVVQVIVDITTKDKESLSLKRINLLANLLSDQNNVEKPILAGVNYSKNDDINFNFYLENE